MEITVKLRAWGEKGGRGEGEFSRFLGGSLGFQATALHAPEQVEGEAADASVEDVLDENVHDILGADGSRAELRGRRGKSRS